MRKFTGWSLQMPITMILALAILAAFLGTQGYLLRILVIMINAPSVLIGGVMKLFGEATGGIVKYLSGLGG